MNTGPLGFPGGSVVKNSPAMQEAQETHIRSLGQGDPLEDSIAMECSCLENPVERGAWGSTVHRLQRVRHD